MRGTSLQSVVEEVDREAARFAALSDDIWDHPEVALRETYSSDVLARLLEEAGFAVRRGVAGLPTAFVAEYGEGRPVVGLLGEFDALPGLSQVRGVCERREAAHGGPGHGCGHNLLGVGAAAAALAVKRSIERGELHGRVRYFGCPAEETLVGKVFMVKAGLFDGVDCALTWHPATVNGVTSAATLAVNSAVFTFRGVAAHAGAEPENGRSALDAVELMNVGVNYLREHVPASARIHYVITAGGTAPNIVPDHAQVWYYVRAPRRAEVEAIYARILDVARGACLMTGTTHEVRLVCGCYDRLPNRTLGEIAQANMQRVGAPRFSQEERQLAQRLRATLSEETLRRPRLRGGSAGPDEALFEGVVPGHSPGEPDPFSSDTGDVSHVLPLAQIHAVTAPIGIPGHSWQNVVAVGSSIGTKGMCFAAKVLAATACDLMRDPQRLAAAWEEFRRATDGEPYLSPVRDVPAPPLDGL